MLTDLSRAARKLARTPGFSAVAVITLAIGLGANTALFSVLRGVLWAPLPFAESERLVALRCVYPDLPAPVTASEGEFNAWQAQSDLFAATAAYARTSLPLTLPNSAPRSLSGMQITPNYLAVLGLRPLLGRDFTATDAVKGAPPVVLITHALWQAQFNADPAIVGQTVRLGGAAATVVGVLPEAYRGTLPNERTPEFLQPLDLVPGEARSQRHYLTIFARLQTDVSVEQAARRLGEIQAQRKREDATQHGVAVERLDELANAALRPRLLTLAVAIGLILLIACVNVANLMLVRVTGRTGEIAVKLALGASRRRISREIVCEGLLLGGAAALLGCGLAALALDAAGQLLRAQFPTFAPFALDGAVLAFAVALTLATVLLFSLLPAWRVTAAWEHYMHSLGKSSTALPGQRRLARLFVGGQIALTMLLLVGTGLLLRSMQRILTQENGFRTEQVVVAGLNLPATRYADREGRRIFIERLLARLRAVPGIESAVAADSVPLAAGSYGPAVIRGVTWPKDEAPMIDRASVGPGYFAALGVSLREGREFTAADTLDAPLGVVVNESYARRFFPGESPLGREVSFDSGPAPERWERIIGVVADVRLNALDRDPAPAMFACYLQSWVPFMFVIVRSPLDAGAVAGIVRTELAALDPELPLGRVAPLQSYLDSSLAPRVLLTWTIGAASLLALGLAALGLYSVVAQTVAQQTREIGIRMALGADGRAIRRWVVGEGLTLVAAGLAAGTAGSFLLARLLGSLVYGVPPWDPVTYAGVGALLGGIAFLAGWWPARRAARVDPLEALRSD